MSASPNLLWQQYELHIDLYKFYLEIILKANTFLYAITGGIVAYYFKNATLPMMKYSLLLPVAMSLIVAAVFFYGAHTLGVVRQELFGIRDKLGFDTAPEVMVLIVALRLFAILLLGVAVGLLFVLLWL